jgi:hypothetical protein
MANFRSLTLKQEMGNPWIKTFIILKPKPLPERPSSFPNFREEFC